MITLKKQSSIEKTRISKESHFSIFTLSSIIEVINIEEFI